MAICTKVHCDLKGHATEQKPFKKQQTIKDVQEAHMLFSSSCSLPAFEDQAPQSSHEACSAQP